MSEDGYLIPKHRRIPLILLELARVTKERDDALQEVSRLKGLLRAEEGSEG